MSQPIQIVCPHCNQSLKVAGATGGKQVRCPQCHGFIRVPSAMEHASSGPTRWIVRTENGKIYGPCSREELEQWVQEGRVHAQCHISAEGAQQWIWAAEMFPQIAAQAAPSPSAPSPSASSRLGAAPVAPAAPAAPVYAQPIHIGPTVSERSRLVAGLLGLLLPLFGLFGVHRLYTGHVGMGLLMLITCGGCWVWQLIDVILVFSGAVNDADGRPLRD
jgi:hypothetical protein